MTETAQRMRVVHLTGPCASSLCELVRGGCRELHPLRHPCCLFCLSSRVAPCFFLLPCCFPSVTCHLLGRHFGSSTQCPLFVADQYTLELEKTGRAGGVQRFGNPDELKRRLADREASYGAFTRKGERALPPTSHSSDGLCIERHLGPMSYRSSLSGCRAT